jgi:hypothetical protein
VLRFRINNITVVRLNKLSELSRWLLEVELSRPGRLLGWLRGTNIILTGCGVSKRFVALNREHLVSRASVDRDIWALQECESGESVPGPVPVAIAALSLMCSSSSIDLSLEINKFPR